MNKIGLLVIDMVYDFTNPSGKIYYPGNDHILPKIIELIHLCKSYHQKVYYIQHSLTQSEALQQVKQTRLCCIQGSGGDQLDERLPYDPKEDKIIPKKTYSGFFNTTLKETLDQDEIDQLIVVGTKTNNCVYATVLDAYNYHYPVYVVKECVGTKDALTNDLYLRDIDQYLGKVIGFDEVFALLESGENDEKI